MKKIIISLVVFMSLFLIFNKTLLNAENEKIMKKLYVFKDSSSSLNVEGYHLIDTNINYSEEGIYYAKYQKIDSLEIYTREIEIISINDVLTNDIKKINKQETYEVKEEIIKSTYFDNVSYFLLRDNSKFYITKEEGEKNLLNFGMKNVFINDFFIPSNEDVFYVTGTVKDKNGYNDCYIAKFSLDGYLIYEQVLEGSNNDIGFEIKEASGYLYVFGNTTSNDLDFNHSLKNEDSFIYILNEINGEKIKYIDTGMSGIDSIITSFLGNYLYIVQSFYAEGHFNAKLSVLDLGGNLIREKVLPVYTNISKIKVYESEKKIFVIYDYFDDSLKDIITKGLFIDENNNIHHLFNLDSNFGNLIDFEVINNKFYFLLQNINLELEEKYCINLVVYDDGSFISKDNVTFFNVDKVGFIRGSDKFFTHSEGILSIYEYNYLNGKAIDTTVVEGIYEIPCFYDKDGSLLLNKEKSIIKVNPLLYGTYKESYYYEGLSYDILLEKNVTVPLQTNVVPNGVYDLNTALHFNGIAILNGMEINNGYILEKEGEYQLVVYGANKAKTIIDFEVQLTHNLNTNFKIDEEIQYSIETNNKPDEKINVKHNLTDVTSLKKNAQLDLWMLLIPFSLSVILTVVFFKVGKRG